MSKILVLVAIAFGLSGTAWAEKVVPGPNVVKIVVNLQAKQLIATYPGGSFGPVPVAVPGFTGGHPHSAPATGCYGPLLPQKENFNHKYNIETDYIMFYQGRYDIHAANNENAGELNLPTHGSIRLKRSDAIKLFQIVEQQGDKGCNAAVCIIH